MRIILCYCCGRQRHVEHIKKDARLVCSNCGANSPLILSSRRANKWWTDTDERDGDNADEARHRLMGGLYWQRDQKGYKAGWAAWRFRHMFGRWPNGEAAAGVQPPSSGLMGYIRRDNAAYAKQMRAGEAANVDTLASVRAESSLMSAEDWDAKL
jgi:hypothetical protein